MGQGGFDNWQFGQVFGTLALVASLHVIRSLYRKPKGERLKTKRAVLLAILVPFTGFMALIYAAGTAPLYQARSRVIEVTELIEQATGAEIVEVRTYPRIMSVMTHRPRTFPVSCIEGSVIGGGGATYDRPILADDFTLFAQLLIDQGYEVNNGLNSDGTLAVTAVRSDRSVQITRPQDLEDARVFINVDLFCELN